MDDRTSRVELYGRGANAATLDDEAQAFLSGFLAANNWLNLTWLPSYRETTGLIQRGLSDGNPQELFAILWRTVDNSIADAGRGMMKISDVDRLREDFIQIIRDVQADGSPECYEQIVERVERWRVEGRIKNVPRLLIRRVFAGVHPRLYHTTVDEPRHDAALGWFAKHMHFAAPTSKNWAARAHALVNHLDRLNLFDGDILVRNMFPWFVVTQLNAQSDGTGIKPGHKKRPSTAFVNLPPAQRTIALRHNDVQTALYAKLSHEYGKNLVWTEHPTGTGGFADAVVRPADGGCYLYEIKIARTSADVTRQAMGQLLEYGFRSNGLEPTKLFVVGEPILDKITERFIERLRTEFNLNIEYLQVELPDRATS
ncbi:hypothetical protein QZM42_31445 [Burkholderia vietnamiensis]|uniref:hypothetical protein n=1 Tax=Burkholderia vietnamiensis TaxID=60552 RepID=UPI00264CB3AD|nr:hypothetical protein [Burkholderia vietnamiensis]MDN7413046.1 hypothetical protein [Burkholderia vietnamiensis]